MKLRGRLSNARTVDLLLLLLLGGVWGSSYLFIRIGVAEVPPFTFVAGRLALSAAILWLLLPVLGYSIPLDPALWGAFAVMGFLSGALPYSLITWGEQHISSGLAALLQSTMPLFTVILAHFWSADERLTGVKVLGVAAGFVGVGVLMLPDLWQGLQASLLSQLAVVGSSLSYAGSVIFARNRLRGQPPLVSMMGQVTTGMLMMLPLSLLLDRPFDLSLSLGVWGSWLAIAILGTVVAYVIYYALIDRTNATFVSTVTYIIPVNGLMLGALVLGEPLSVTLLGGLALILLGVLLVRS